VRRIYWAIVNREALVASQDEEKFYRELLAGFSQGGLIFDVGANGGAKTDIFLKLGARVVAVEPDETNLTTLRERFLQYRLRSVPVTLVGKALSDKIAVEKMWIDGPGSAVNTLNRIWADHLSTQSGTFKHQHHGLSFSNSKSVETTTIDNLIKLHGLPYFIKIDVEGYELNVLRGMSIPVPFLSFEVNLRVLRKEGIECVQLLRKLRSEGEFNYTPDCCAGLSLESWVEADRICAILESCEDETIEVFWRSNCSGAI